FYHLEVCQYTSVRSPLLYKDDAIAQLSDQVMALTARMQEFERENNNNHINYEFTTIATYRTKYNASLAT
ncbi:MAG TPA: hypothetical protein VE593_00365, partial [Nitrososphaeraceae archaeon]|nr:hypothetical protein [Nitrososphaeraceae archaeon]